RVVGGTAARTALCLQRRGAAALLPAAPRAGRPVRARRAPVRCARPRRRRRGAGLAPRRPLLPHRGRDGRAAGLLLSRPLQPARRETRRCLDGRVRRTCGGPPPCPQTSGRPPATPPRA